MAGGGGDGVREGAGRRVVGRQERLEVRSGGLGVGSGVLSASVRNTAGKKIAGLPSSSKISLTCAQNWSMIVSLPAFKSTRVVVKSVTLAATVIATLASAGHSVPVLFAWSTLSATAIQAEISGPSVSPLAMAEISLSPTCRTSCWRDIVGRCIDAGSLSR